MGKLILELSFDDIIDFVHSRLEGLEGFSVVNIKLSKFDNSLKCKCNSKLMKITLRDDI